MGEQIKAIAMLSGGLDSTLAVAIIKAQGVAVQAVNFFTGFCIVERRRAVGSEKAEQKYRHDALEAAAKLGVPIELIDISGPEYLAIVTNPKYGHGSAINPCLDCRVFMARRAKAYMEEVGAHFVISGEVLGQRPMSQYRRALDIVAEDSGLGRLLLRPLSAKLLPKTIPEERGWVDRERLYAISGRGRKQQMALAQQFGIEEYPQPAGGCCFLTDKVYARRMRDYLRHRVDDRPLTMEDLLLLKVGRHLRLSERLKVVVGRDEGENNFLQASAGDRWRFTTVDHPGPLVVVEGTPASPQEVELIARITAGYSDGKDEAEVRVQYSGDGEEAIITVAPLSRDELKAMSV